MIMVLISNKIKYKMNKKKDIIVSHYYCLCTCTSTLYTHAFKTKLLFKLMNVTTKNLEISCMDIDIQHFNLRF